MIVNSLLPIAKSRSARGAIANSGVATLWRRVLHLLTPLNSLLGRWRTRETILMTRGRFAVRYRNRRSCRANRPATTRRIEPHAPDGLSLLPLLMRLRVDGRRPPAWGKISEKDGHRRRTWRPRGGLPGERNRRGCPWSMSVRAHDRERSSLSRLRLFLRQDVRGEIARPPARRASASAQEGKQLFDLVVARIFSAPPTTGPLKVMARDRLPAEYDPACNATWPGRRGHTRRTGRVRRPGSAPVSRWPQRVGPHDTGPRRAC